MDVAVRLLSSIGETPPFTDGNPHVGMLLYGDYRERVKGLSSRAVRIRDSRNRQNGDDTSAFGKEFAAPSKRLSPRRQSVFPLWTGGTPSVFDGLGGITSGSSRLSRTLVLGKSLLRVCDDLLVLRIVFSRDSDGSF